MQDSKSDAKEIRLGIRVAFSMSKEKFSELSTDLKETLLKTLDEQLNRDDLSSFSIQFVSDPELRPDISEPWDPRTRDEINLIVEVAISTQGKVSALGIDIKETLLKALEEHFNLADLSRFSVKVVINSLDLKSDDWLDEWVNV